MAYKREMFEKAKQIIDKRRTDAEEAAEARRRDFEKKVPEYGELRNILIRSVTEAMKTINMDFTLFTRGFL